jgi:protein-S-isoprenylcysteine O-methyltransferase Ste14
VLLALVALSALVGLGWPAAWRPYAAAVAFALMLVGLGLLVAGAVGLGSALTPFPRPREDASLMEGGVYARARHPIYGGVVLLAGGWSLVFASVLGGVLTLALVVFFVLKARREEEWLRAQYPEYDDYARRTKRGFVPWVW